MVNNGKFAKLPAPNIANKLMLKIFTEPTDKFLTLVKKNSRTSPAIYQYSDFDWQGKKLFYGPNPFIGFSPSDRVLFRQDRDYSAGISFWIRTLAVSAHNSGARVLNSKVWESFPHYSDKYAQALMFAAAGISHVSTMLLSDFVSRRRSFPIIIKPRLGCMGRGIKIVTTPAQLSQFISAVNPQNYIVQPFFNLNRDVRSLVVAGKIFGAVIRTVKLYPDGKIGVKVSRPAILTPAETRLTNSCIRGLGIDLMGVDLLTDSAGHTRVGEINLAPNVSGFSRVTGVNAAAEIVKFLRGTISS